MKRSTLIALAWSFIATGLFLGFQNCGQVDFAPSNEVLKSEIVEQASVSALLIDDGAPYATQTQVRLKLFSPRALEMKISDQDNCGDGTWETYSSARDWVLKSKNANASVRAQFKDIRGNVSPCVSDDIEHDDVPPTLSFKNAAGFQTAGGSVAVEWTLNDNYSGVDGATCVDAAGNTASCTNMLTSSATKEGVNEIVVRARDKAGNESLPFKYSWLRDTVAPTVGINRAPAAVVGSADATFEFSGSDTGSGIAAYKCKIDAAAEQTCASPVQFTGLVSGAHTFTVQAVDRVGNKSTVASAMWTVDMSAPSIELTSTPPAYSASTQASFGFRGTDDGQPVTHFECRVNGATFTSCSSPRVFNGLSQGANTFEVLAIDTVGNRSSPVIYQWTIDTTKPSISITSGPSSVTNAVTAALAWTASDAGSGVKSVQCRLDGAAFAACSNMNANYMNLAPGDHTFEVKAIDQAGNEQTASRSWTIDTTAPTVTITSAPAAQVRETVGSFQFTGSDASGIARYECRLDAGTYAACASPKAYEGLVEGGHSFFVRAVDIAGNVSAPAAHSWNIDRSPPLIRILSAPGALLAGDSANVSYEVIDAASGVALVRCGFTAPTNNVADCSAVGVKSLGSLLAGEYTYEIYAADRVGNAITESLTVRVSARPLVCDPFSVTGEQLCNGGMIGEIYYLSSQQQSTFKSMSGKSVDYLIQNGQRVNALVNLKQFAVQPRAFNQGFPMSDGSLVKDGSGNALVEYFAFRMNTVLKLDPTLNQAGWYQFATYSDDGSIVALKSTPTGAFETVVANDGDHAPRFGCGGAAVYLDDSSRFPMEVKYYQGPREQIAMVLMWRRVSAMNSALDPACGTSTAPGGDWKIIAPTNMIAPTN